MPRCLIDSFGVISGRWRFVGGGSSADQKCRLHGIRHRQILGQEYGRDPVRQIRGPGGATRKSSGENRVITFIPVNAHQWNTSWLALQLKPTPLTRNKRSQSNVAMEKGEGAGNKTIIPPPSVLPEKTATLSYTSRDVRCASLRCH